MFSHVGDLDPASLVEASSFPNARAITLPVALDQAFDSYGNKDLYARQVGPAFEQLLDSPSRGLRTVANEIHRQRKGLVQESMIGRGVALQVEAI